MGLTWCIRIFSSWRGHFGFMAAFLLVVLGSGLIEAQTCTNDPAAIAAFINKVRQEVNVLAGRAQENEKNECSLLAVCNVTLSSFQCSNISTANLTCTDTVKLTTPNSYCSNLTCNNQLFNFKEAATKLHPGISVYPTTGSIVTYALDSERIYERAICKQNFTDIFQQMNNGLRINASAPFANWRYYGTILGISSTHPFQVGPQKTIAGMVADSVACAVPYDCRLRPWYVGAISPRKVLLILIDVGPSMGFSANTAQVVGPAISKIEVARAAASALLYSLKAGDAVAVITFADSNDVQVLASSLAPVDPAIGYSPLGIEDVDPANRPSAAVLNASIYQNTTVRTTGESTGLRSAILKALDLLGSKLRGCHKSFVVLTDGQGLGPTNSTPISADIAAAVAAQGQPITPFLFSVGAAENDGQNLLKGIACGVNGTWARIPDAENVLYNMRSYFNFQARTAVGINGSYFSGVYEDANGLGRVFTISQPVFHPLTGDLIGVAGADVSVTATTSYCSSAINKYLTELSNVQERCLNVTAFDKCLIPAVRGADNDYCPTPSDCKITQVPDCPNISTLVPSSAMRPPLVASRNISSTRCCKSCSLGGLPA